MVPPKWCIFSASSFCAFAFKCGEISALWDHSSFETLPLDLPNMGGSTKIHWRQATQYDTQTASKIVTRLQRENITHVLYLPHRSHGYKGPPESLVGSFGETFW